MRHPLLLLPLATLALAGCVGAPAPQRVSTNYMTPERSVTYMTPEQSATLFVLPGDTTTPAQMRFLSTTSLSANDLRANGDIPRSSGL
jgi:hypothetical protein